jgi:hypothetical protein
VPIAAKPKARSVPTSEVANSSIHIIMSTLGQGVIEPPVAAIRFVGFRLC